MSNKPSAILIGDSICMGYRPLVQQRLSDKMDILGVTENGGDSDNLLKNLDELANALPEMGDDTFHHHVNNEKNDFSSWIKEALGDQRLANDLLSSKSREFIAKKIRNRLNSLKKIAG